jgi:predicted KAP-like P-loop ATPase
LSGTGNIPSAFFRELGIALREEWPDNEVEKGTKKLNAYATGLSLAGTTTSWVGKAMPWLAIPGGPVIEAVGKSMKAAGTVVKEGSAALTAKNATDLKSLREQKQAVTRSLTGLSRPLLVVVDDIDRLTTDEILQVFQLVKANADFPRLIYLLLFEREVVSSALNAVSGNKGGEFLEKIVQVGYHIPHASQASIQKVLFSGLDIHLSHVAVSKRWDKYRWANLYSDGIASYFRNLRHVYRFLASFAFHVRQHQTKTSFEVNPVDLVGLETLRVFEPSVYESLPAAKTILTRYEGRNTFTGIP